MFGKKRIYIDWASAAPVSGAVQRAFERAEAFGNPSSPHSEGRAAKVTLEDARTRIARLVGAKADDVVFTSGATEANNLSIRGHIAALRAEGRTAADIHILYLPSAHASVVETAHALAAEGCEVEALKIKDGAIDTTALEAQLKSQTALVAIDAICGETGTIWNVRDVRRILNEKKSTTLLHVDASQVPLSESIERSRFGADMLVLDASKVGGVRGIGALVVPRTIPISALIEGGGQERSIRPGTESPALAAAFATALEECKEKHDEFEARAKRARDAFLEKLTAAQLPNTFVNEGKKQSAHILNISFVGRDTDYLVALLDEAGIAASTKSACETDSEDGSRAVFALTNDAARAKSTLRLSWGPSTTDRELSRAADALITAVRFLDIHNA